MVGEGKGFVMLRNFFARCFSKGFDIATKRYERKRPLCFPYSLRKNLLTKIIINLLVKTKTKTPTLFVGVTANHVYIDWAENIALPDGEELVKVEQELREIRDVCTRIQFRGLGLLATTLAYYAFIKWLWEKEKTAYLAHINKENIHIATIKRN